MVMKILFVLFATVFSVSAANAEIWCSERTDDCSDRIVMSGDFRIEVTLGGETRYVFHVGVGTGFRYADLDDWETHEPFAIYTFLDPERIIFTKLDDPVQSMVIFQRQALW